MTSCSTLTGSSNAGAMLLRVALASSSEATLGPRSVPQRSHTCDDIGRLFRHSGDSSGYSGSAVVALPQSLAEVGATPQTKEASRAGAPEVRPLEQGRGEAEAPAHASRQSAGQSRISTFNSGCRCRPLSSSLASETTSGSPKAFTAASAQSRSAASLPTGVPAHTDSSQEHRTVAPDGSFISPDAVEGLVGDNVCSICLELLKNKSIVVTRCGHGFHWSCLTRSGASVCPQCRQQLDVSPAFPPDTERSSIASLSASWELPNIVEEVHIYVEHIVLDRVGLVVEHVTPDRVGVVVLPAPGAGRLGQRRPSLPSPPPPPPPPFPPLPRFTSMPPPRGHVGPSAPRARWWA